jgi:hypothetical protein
MLLYSVDNATLPLFSYSVEGQIEVTLQKGRVSQTTRPFSLLLLYLLQMTYHDIDGFFAFERFYRHVADNLSDGMRIAEVGAYKGKSTSFMAQKIKQRGIHVTFYAIDHWLGSSEHQHLADVRSLFQIFTQNMTECGLTEYVVPVRKPSVEAARLFADGSLDLVFIDAGHSFEDVKQDIQAWLPKVKPGGILGGDDYHPKSWPGVVKAVDEAFGASVQKDFLPAWYIYKE